MSGGRTSDATGVPQADRSEIPVWLELQRCRGIGWLRANRGVCLGLGDSGRGAALFSRVVLVPADDDSNTADVGAAAGGNSSNIHGNVERASSMSAMKRRENIHVALRVLDQVPGVEVEAEAWEADERGGYGESDGLFAAIIAPSVPTEDEAHETSKIEGEFVVMHRVEESLPQDEGVEELHLCFGELLWHPTPPRLFACRSLWNTPQRMQLTKSVDLHKLTAQDSASAAAGSSTTIVLTDVEEETPAASIASLEYLRGALGDSEALRRIASDTFSLSFSSLRQTPETIVRLSSATMDFLQKASADWVTFGTTAIETAGAVGEKARRLWKSVREREGSDRNKKDGDS